jgi:hypothetical protein
MIVNNPLKIIALVCGIIVIKAGVLFLTGKFSRLSFDQNLLFTLGLAQVGNLPLFSFPLFTNSIFCPLNGRI